MKSLSKAVSTTILLLAVSACSDDDAPEEQLSAIDRLTGLWTAQCAENPQADTIEPQDIGYFKETLLVDGNRATQTWEYFEDPECSLPVTPGQVSNLESTIFIQKQSLEMAIAFPFGTTETDLGAAQHVTFTELSVAIDGETLSDSELEDQAIVLGEQLGIFIITDSDQLHLGAAAEGGRPGTVPMDRYYIRSPDWTLDTTDPETPTDRQLVLGFQPTSR